MDSSVDITMAMASWGIIIILCFYIILIFVLMELLLGKTKEKNGRLQINKQSFILRSIYGLNFFQKEDAHKIYPKNLCEFFWGLFFSLILGSIVSILMSIIFVIRPFVKSIFYLMCLLLGKLPEEKNKEGFKPYQRYGKNSEKKFIAGWKFCVPVIVFYGFYYEPSITIFLIGILGLGIVLCAVIKAIAILEYWLTNKTSFKSKMTVLKKFLKSKKEKVCPLLDIVNE